MKDHPDADLVELTRQRGETAAYGELVKRYQGHAYGLAYSLLSDWAQAEDMAQEAFIRAYINLNTLEDPSRFAAWLRRIVFGTCMDWMRAFRPQLYRSMGNADDVDQIDSIPDEDAETPLEQTERRELSGEVLSAISELPPKYRIPLTMFHLDGLSYEKVADFLDVPLGTAKSLISRARKKLKPALEAYAAEVLPSLGEIFDEHKLGEDFVTATVKRLEGFQWKPAYTTQMGSIAAGLDYLNEQGKMAEPVSTAWLYGGTGQAFLICMHPIVCPSGPFVRDLDDLRRLCRNIGCRVEGVVGHRDDADFSEKQQAAWQHVRESIDKGLPCYALQLGIAEYGPIHGYDEAGYYFTGLTSNDGQVTSGIKPWNELALAPEPYLQVFSLEPCQPASTGETVRDALVYALQYNSLEHLRDSGYATGEDAYAAWVKALADGTALNHGHAYNAAVWAECRAHAVDFLKEAKERLGGKAEAEIDEAIGLYSTVAEKLKDVAERHPLSGKLEGDLKDREAAEAIRAAGEVEQEGMEALRRIVEAM
jgi:RNA polymerase sigma-70 factor, ECF subfamily